MERFTAHADGVELTLAPEEVETLLMIPELLESVGVMADDPAEARLSITTYPEDDDSESEFNRLMKPEIEAGRAADRSALQALLEAARDQPVVLSMGEAEAWLLVLNEARLALAARLGIEEEGWDDDLDDDDALAPPMAFLDYLSYLHGELTLVLMEKLS
jgi:RimJ/RimL family protein N-acetyltransferase